MGASISWNSQGLSRPVMGLLYLFYLRYWDTTEYLILTSFLFYDSVQTCSGVQLASSSIVMVTTFRGLKRPEREADDSFLLVPWLELNGATRVIPRVTPWLVSRHMYHLSLLKFFHDIRLIKNKSKRVPSIFEDESSGSCI
jgi:hypothetical protein